MRFFKDSDERTYSKAKKRLGRVDQGVVVDWANTTLWAVQEGLEGAQDDRAALLQARTGVVTLLAAVDTLLDRTLVTRETKS